MSFEQYFFLMVNLHLNSDLNLFKYKKAIKQSRIEKINHSIIHRDLFKMFKGLINKKIIKMI